MFSPLRNRFGIPGVISVIALVFAMIGGAYAASGGLTSKQKKEVKSIAKSFQGTGPAGAAGPAGAKGDTGAKGDKGDTGNTGNAGAAGKSVTTTAITTAGLEGHCVEAGGTKVQVEGSATKEYVCNGEAGEDGEAGFTEVLPPNKTETGSWSAQFSEFGLSSISFNIPLAAPLDEEHVAFHGQGYTGDEGGIGPNPGEQCEGKSGTELTECEEEHENCPGKAADPQAAPGHLCVYSAQTFHLAVTIFNPGKGGFPPSEGGAGTAGAGFFMEETSPGGAFGFGQFAVTAPGP